jgi:hypothetical protein
VSVRLATHAAQPLRGRFGMGLLPDQYYQC